MMLEKYRETILLLRYKILLDPPLRLLLAIVPPAFRLMLLTSLWIFQMALAQVYLVPHIRLYHFALIQPT